MRLWVDSQSNAFFFLIHYFQSHMLGNIYLGYLIRIEIIIELENKKHLGFLLSILSCSLWR